MTWIKRPLFAVILEKFIGHGSYFQFRLALLLAPALLAAEGSKLLHRNQIKGIDPVHGKEDCHCSEES